MNTIARNFTLAALLLRTLPVAAAISPGFVVGWGNNLAGQATGVPSFPSSNGVVIITDRANATGVVAIAGQLLNNAIAVAAGRFGASQCIALRSDRTVVGWGNNA